jgi:hypothetical protein
MTESVFYAWQCDLPNKTNRSFIRHAIDQAIELVNRSLGVDEALRPDQDTQGVPGDINVAEVIFDKIRQARIFVADITTTTPRGSARPSPNPNVLIEYGRASVDPGSDCIVTVFNEAFGTWETDRPFDMRHRRKPVTYRLVPSHTTEEREVALNKLSRALAEVFTAILQVQPVAVRVPPTSDFDELRNYYFSTVPRDQSTGRIIGLWCGAIPVDFAIDLARPWEDERLVHRLPTFPLGLGASTIQIEVLGGSTSEGAFTFKPIHNGASGQWDRRFRSLNRERPRPVENVASVYVRTNGRIAIVVRTTELAPQPMLNIRWIMAEVANTLLVINRVRQAAQNPLARYALFVELRYDDQESSSIIKPVQSGEWWLCNLSDETGRVGKLVSSDPRAYGPFLVGPSASFAKVLSDIFVEIETSVARRPEPDINFELTLNEDILNRQN